MEISFQFSYAKKIFVKSKSFVLMQVEMAECVSTHEDITGIENSLSLSFFLSLSFTLSLLLSLSLSLSAIKPWRAYKLTPIGILFLKVSHLMWWFINTASLFLLDFGLVQFVRPSWILKVSKITEHVQPDGAKDLCSY